MSILNITSTWEPTSESSLKPLNLSYHTATTTTTTTTTKTSNILSFPNLLLQILPPDFFRYFCLRLILLHPNTFSALIFCFSLYQLFPLSLQFHQLQLSTLKTLLTVGSVPIVQTQYLNTDLITLQDESHRVCLSIKK